MCNKKLIIGKQYRVNTKHEGMDISVTKDGLMVCPSMRKMEGEIVTVESVGVTHGRGRVKGSHYWWDSNILVPLEMIKDEWLIAIINGAVGIVDNSSNKYTYSKESHKFSSGGVVCEMNWIDPNWIDHRCKFTIAEPTDEMTLEEVCKELGRDIKIVQ